MDRHDKLYRSLTAFLAEDLETTKKLISEVTQDIAKSVVNEMCGKKHDDEKCETCGKDTYEDAEDACDCDNKT